MKKTLLISLIILVITAALCSCSKNAPGEDLTADITPDENKTYSFTRGKTAPPTSYTDYKDAAFGFSVKTLLNFSENKKSFIYSPSAFYSQLSLLQNAASADTQSRIREFTGETLSLDSLNECNGYFFSRIEKLSKFDKNKYIDINGDFFFNTNTPVSQNFLIKNADFYNQGIFRLDFSQNNFTGIINSYLSNTRNSGYSSKPDKNSGMLLLNSAYLKDNWMDSFTEKSREVFSGENKNKTSEFYSSTEYYIEDKNCEGFIKDLKNTPAKFIALVPKKGSVKNLLKKLDYTAYSQIIDSMSVFKTCKAVVPKFSGNSEINFTDNKTFRFLKSKGNYSGLTYGTKTNVSDIIQRYEFKFTKNGIGTNKASKSNSTKKKADKTVKFNRPFYFAVIDNESNIPIFSGIISDI